MPRRIGTPCAWPHCNKVTIETYCPLHQGIAAGRKNNTNPARQYHYLYDRKWRKARAAYLLDHPFCEDCEAEGRLEAATIVDHRVPHLGDPVLFWDQSSWRGLCRTHHNRKTATEDGGFGNPRSVR
jgi:5-methylcytosine-specific restriction protein A